MKKFFIMIPLVVLLVIALGSIASAEWLYATRGDTFVHPVTDVDSERIGVFAKGEKIWVYDHTYTDDGRNWCRVTYLGKEGYISDRYSSYDVPNEEDYTDVNQNAEVPFIKFSEEDEEDDYDDGEEPEVRILDDYCEPEDITYEVPFEFIVYGDTPVYSWFEDGDIIGKVKSGDSVLGSRIYISESGNPFLEVYIDSESDGYLRMDDMYIVEGDFPKFYRFMRVNGGTINLRTAPDINSDRLGILTLDEIIDVDYFVCVYDEEYRIWAHAVDYDGFVSCKYLEPAY